MMSSPNIFETLFTYRPREGHTPEENFLTEGFSYVLQTSEDARIEWLNEILGMDTDIADHPVIETQKRYNHPDNSEYIIVDMAITFTTPKGEKISVLSEHKWHSPTDRDQLRKYIEIAKKIRDRAIVTFICSNWQQRKKAADSDSAIKKLLWEDVYRCLKRIPNPHSTVKDFTDFLRSQGLSSFEPITIAKMVSFINGNNLPEICKGYAKKLSTFGWSEIPKRYRDQPPQVTDRWGRVGIEFHRVGRWSPCITTGFLYHGGDHCVELIDPNRGIDLLLRIEAVANECQSFGEVDKVITKKAEELQTFAYDIKERGETQNQNTILLVRECLADTIKDRKTEEEQVEAIYTRLLQWCDVLFKDHELEKALKQTFGD